MDNRQQPAPENAGRDGAGLRPRPAEIATVVTVIALILAACWPAIRVSFGFTGKAILPAEARPNGTAASTTEQPTPGLTIAGAKWSLKPVASLVLHATGAELSWQSYVNSTGYPGYDLAAYEVHRGTRSDFTPSAATLVATVNAHDTSFVDTTAPASSGPTPAITSTWWRCAPGPDS